MLNGTYFASAIGVTLLGTAVVLNAQAGEAYFPPERDQTAFACPMWGRGGNHVSVDGFYADWFSSHLRVAEEPSLYLASLGSNGGRALRLDWYRSFHPAIFVRIDFAPEGGARLTATELSGAGGYSSHGVDRRTQRQLSQQEILELERLLADTRPFDDLSVACDIGLDGAQWVLEEASVRTYRVVNQWSPEEGPVREVGTYLLSLTGWTIEPVY